MNGARARQVAEMYAATFAGRSDCYQLFDKAAGHWLPVRQPLTPEPIIAALTRTGPPLGFYFLGPSNSTHVGAVDFDGPDGWGQALAVGRALLDAGLRCYVEHSRRGAHLWMILAEPVPAIALRRALRAACQVAGLADDDPKVELRPATDRLSTPDGLGSALRGPMMPHPATGEAFPLCDPRSGEPVHTKAAGMLLALELCAVDLLTGYAETCRLPALAPAPERRPFEGDSLIARFNTVGVSAVLARDWGVTNAAPGRSVRCPGHDDKSPSLAIARDDSRAWCHSPGCELHGPDGRGHDPYSLWQLAKARQAVTG